MPPVATPSSTRKSASTSLHHLHAQYTEIGELVQVLDLVDFIFTQVQTGQSGERVQVGDFLSTQNR